MNLIEKIVTEMGSRWTPTGQLEVGIDGYVELFDPTTREPVGLHLSLQSKAVTTFAGQGEKITFPCKRDDIAYWLATSPRVVLVVSQPSSGEAYWLSVRDFFGSDEHKDKTVAIFDRVANRLTASSYDQLLEVARPPQRAVARSPVLVRETLYSNLIPLQRFPNSIFIAAAVCRGYEAARELLRQQTEAYPPRTWALREDVLFSFADPSEGPLSCLVDSSSVETHDARAWASTSDEEKRRVFVELLNGALHEDLGAIGVRFYNDDEVFAFKGTLDRVPRTYTFHNLHQRSTITVVTRYESRSKDGRVFPYLRHGAFRGRFRRFDDSWFLEITPTYRFTTDGVRKYRFHENQLAGIKRLEGNRAVLSQVLLWNEVLIGQVTLFDRRRRVLGFGSCCTMQLERGIPDADWTPIVRDEEDARHEPLLAILGSSQGGSQ